MPGVSTKHNLASCIVHNALDMMAGRLRFRGRNRQLRANEPIEQRRLPNVRAPKDSDKAYFHNLSFYDMHRVMLFLIAHNIRSLTTSDRCSAMPMRLAWIISI